LSLFPVGSGTSTRPAGLYGAAFVDYRAGTLTYRELLVARLVRDGAVPRVSITDIWVDSPASRDGARSLWAIPKDLAELHLDTRGRGPVHRTAWDANLGGTPVAAARFTVPRLPGLRSSSTRPSATRWLRTPYAFTVLQHRADDSRALTRVTGTARPRPAVARWDFGHDGPLSWLAGGVSVGSLVLENFAMTFGG
jgi:acetoacetate decarboxylase